MSNNKNRMIVFASILGAILATSILALNPSTITSAGAQMYGDHQYGYDSNYYQDDNRYGYDNHEKKSSHGDIQKIKCVNSNINVNGVDITEIPEDDFATTAAADEGEEGTNAANSQNGNAFDKINFDRNLVNICVNVNDNDQLKVQFPQRPPIEIEGCEGCFITAIANSPDPAQNAQNLIDTLENPGISITLVANVFVVHSLTELCQVLDLAPTRGILENGVQNVIDQAQLDLGVGGQQALEDCLAAEFGFPPN